MPKKLPPLPALQAFEAAARHENFTAAAKELNLSQSAVSHRVRSLEHHLGHPLFERLPRGLRLTESAKAYLPSVRHAFEDILSATSGIFGQSGKTVLNLRAPISYATLWLAPLVDRFQQEFPHIEVHLSSSIWTERIATHDADVEFRLGHGDWPGFDAEFLFRDPLVVACTPRTATRINAPATPQRIAECTLVHVLGSEDYWAKFFDDAGVGRERKPSDISVDSSLTAAELVASSGRLTLIHQRFAQHFVALERLVIASAEQIVPHEAIYLLTPQSAEPRKPEGVLFERWLKNAISET